MPTSLQCIILHFTALVIANFYQMKENCQKLELNLNTVKLSVRQRQSSTFPMKKNLYYKKA